MQDQSDQTILLVGCKLANMPSILSKAVLTISLLTASFSISPTGVTPLHGAFRGGSRDSLFKPVSTATLSPKEDHIEFPPQDQ